MTRRWFRIADAFAPLLIPQPAQARTTFHELSIEAAMNSPTGKEKLLQIPVYFKGQPHKAVASELGEFTPLEQDTALFLWRYWVDQTLAFKEYARDKFLWRELLGLSERLEAALGGGAQSTQ